MQRTLATSSAAQIYLDWPGPRLFTVYQFRLPSQFLARVETVGLQAGQGGARDVFMQTTNTLE
jgi:hypothetical protein